MPILCPTAGQRWERKLCFRNFGNSRCVGVEGEPLDRPGEALWAKLKLAPNIMSQYIEA